MGPTSQIIAVFGIVKCIHGIVLYLLPTQFDISSSLLLETYRNEKDILCTINSRYPWANKVFHSVSRSLLDRVLDKLVVWDTVYFSDLFVNAPQYEHQFVFCPLWWRLIALVPGYKGAFFYSRMIVATLVANFAHLAAALVLYQYTLAVFLKARIFSPKRMALCLLVLFVMSPAAAFMTAPYSEPMAAFASFLCLYFRQLGLGGSPIVVSSLDANEESETGEIEGEKEVNYDTEKGIDIKIDPFQFDKNSDNSDTNSNSSGRRGPYGMAANSGIPGGKIRISSGKIRIPGEELRSRILSETLRSIPSPVVCPSFTKTPSSFRLGLYLLSGVFAALSYGFRANCLLLGIIYLYDLATLRPFPANCSVVAGLLLGLAFVATQYQNYVSICVGSERGEWCNSSFPVLFTYAQAHYWNNGFFKYWTLNNIPNFIFGAPTIILSFISIRYFREVYPVDRVYPVLIINSVFIVLLLTMWHVQIVTRVHLFLPIIYWLVSGLLTQRNPKHQQWGYICVAYFVIWGVLQTSLLGAFLPPA